jgi:hypothetical protein
VADRRVSAITRLATVLADHAGQTVVYARGDDEASLVGTLTSPSSQSEAARLGTAAGLDLSAVDLVIQAADLVLDGSPVTPQVGDAVTATIAGSAHLFTVSRDGGEDCYRYSDGARVLMRIHLQHVKEIK